MLAVVSNTIICVQIFEAQRQKIKEEVSKITKPDYSYYIEPCNAMEAKRLASLVILTSNLRSYKVTTTAEY